MLQNSSRTEPSLLHVPLWVQFFFLCFMFMSVYTKLSKGNTSRSFVASSHNFYDSVSSTTVFHEVLFGSNNNWCDLMLVTFELISNLLVVSSPVELKLLNNLSSCNHTNIKLLGGGLIAFTFNMSIIVFLSSWDTVLSAETLRFLCSVFSVEHSIIPNSPVTPCQPLNK